MAESNSKYCVHCGTNLSNIANFCFNCGKSCNNEPINSVEMDIHEKLKAISNSSNDPRILDNIQVIQSASGYSDGVKKLRANELLENQLITQIEYDNLISHLDIIEVNLTQQDKINILKKEATDNGVACCPKCGCTTLSANKKGFGIGKAVIGAAVTGGIGLIAGNKGAKKVRITCLNCGKQWWAGK